MEYLNETSQICWSSKVTYCYWGSSLLPFQFMSYLPLIDLKNGFWPVVHLLYGISEWNFTDMLNIKGYIFLVRTVPFQFMSYPPLIDLKNGFWPVVHLLYGVSEWNFTDMLTIKGYILWLRTSLSISVLLLFRHYISHKITFGAPSSGGVLCSACGAFITKLTGYWLNNTMIHL